MGSLHFAWCCGTECTHIRTMQNPECLYSSWVVYHSQFSIGNEGPFLIKDWWVNLLLSRLPKPPQTIGKWQENIILKSQEKSHNPKVWEDAHLASGVKCGLRERRCQEEDRSLDFKLFTNVHNNVTVVKGYSSHWPWMRSVTRAGPCRKQADQWSEVVSKGESMMSHPFHYQGDSIQKEGNCQRKRKRGGSHDQVRKQRLSLRIL